MAQDTKKTGEVADAQAADAACETVVADVGRLIDNARRVALRTINSLMVADYWLIGRSVVGLVKHGLELGLSDEEILRRMGEKLRLRSGAAFTAEKLHCMCRFYLVYSAAEVTAAAAAKEGGPAAKTGLAALARRFSLSWSHYRLLIDAALSSEARAYYEAEAHRKSWSAAELKRQIASRVHEAQEPPQQQTPSLPPCGGEPPAAQSFDEELRDACLLEFFGVALEQQQQEIAAAAEQAAVEPAAEQAAGQSKRKAAPRRKAALSG